jgi:RNA polymerase sigma factor (TIGR02999 family)
LPTLPETDNNMNQVTQILAAVEAGDPSAAAQLLPLVYDELRQLAAAQMAAERPGQTLQATALVHEAYLRLVGPDADIHWNSRGHFFGAAAEAMRRILVEQARRKGRLKRGGDLQKVDLELAVGEQPDEASSFDLLALNEALDLFAAEHPEKANLVKLRFFAGLTMAQASEALGISTATADRHWRFARAWLARSLGHSPSTGENSAKS